MRVNGSWSSSARGLLLLALAGAGTACQALPDIAAGVCGNGVVETGEDCETDLVDEDGTFRCGAPDTTTACFFECDPQRLVERPCRPGRGCGADGRCRTPSGRFAETASLALGVRRGGVADVDGDGRDDLLLSAGTSVDLRFGSPSLDFAQVVTAPLNAPAEGLAAARLDAGDTADLVLSTAGGVETLLGSDARTLTPVTYVGATFEPADTEVAALRVPGGSADALLVAWAGRLGVPLEATAPTPLLVGPGTLLTPLAGLAVDPSDPASERLVPIGVAGGTSIRLARVAAAAATPGSPASVSLDAPAIAVPPLAAGSAIVVGEVDADGCGDVLAQSVVGLVLVRGGCDASGLAGFAEPILVSAGDLGSARLLAAADLDGDGTTDVIATDGPRLLRYVAATPATVTTTRVPGALGTYGVARIADLDGDGRPDVALARLGAQDVEVLLNASTPGAAVFNRGVIATDGAVLGLEIGDLDGDFTPDLGLLVAGEGGSAVAAVAFGERGGFPGPARPMAVVPGAAAIAVANLGTVGAQASVPDGVDALLVLTPDGGADAVEVTALAGTGTRAMSAPLVLTVPGDGDERLVPGPVVTGAFDDAAGTDLLVLASTRSEDDAGGVYGALLTGRGDGSFESVADPVSLATLSVGPGVLRGASWASGDLDADGRDDVVVDLGLPDAADGVVIGGAGSVVAGVVSLPSAAGVAAVSPGLAVVDIDGFDGPDVLRPYREIAVTDDAPATGIDVAWGGGGALPTTLSSLAADPQATDAARCFDAQALQLDPDLQGELLALCRTPDGAQLELLRFDASEPQTLRRDVGTPLPQGLDGDTRSRLFAGDFDGDGLVDLAVALVGAAGSRVVVFRHIPEDEVLASASEPAQE
jgi:hypothetical protein